MPLMGNGNIITLDIVYGSPDRRFLCFLTPVYLGFKYFGEEVLSRYDTSLRGVQAAFTYP